MEVYCLPENYLSGLRFTSGFGSCLPFNFRGRLRSSATRQVFDNRILFSSLPRPKTRRSATPLQALGSLALFLVNPTVWYSLLTHSGYVGRCPDCKTDGIRCKMPSADASRLLQT